MSDMGKPRKTPPGASREEVNWEAIAIAVQDLIAAGQDLGMAADRIALALEALVLVQAAGAELTVRAEGSRAVMAIAKRYGA